MKSALRKLIAPALALALALSGCQKQAPTQEEQIEHKTVYTSFFPFYALAEGLFQNVDEMDLRCLVQPQDGCLRSYDLSEWDLIKVMTADALIIGGRSMESFESLLTGGREGGPAVISALEGMALLGGNAAADDEIESHLQGENPWAFLSVPRAAEITEVIAGGMIELDPGFEQIYLHNLERRQQALEALIVDMRQLVIDAEPQPVALMHEGLPYLADDLGLNVVAQIDREPGTVPYGADMDEALDQLRSGGARVVLLEKQAPDALKKQLKSAGYALALIDTLSTFPTDAGPDYYDQVMLKNARAVAEAFKACS